jgi:hypothetical protein
MTRLLAGSALAVATMLLLGCGSTEPAAGGGDATVESSPAAQEDDTADPGGDLALASGSRLTVDGYSSEGESGPAVPMEIVFVEQTCKQSFEGVDLNEFDEPTDFTAKDGNQLCLLTLDVTNVGDMEGWFAADLTGVLVTEDGTTFPPADSGYDPSIIAENEGVAYAAAIAGIQPGESGRDFVIFELPEAETPSALRFLPAS